MSDPQDHVDVRMHPPVLAVIHLAAALLLGWLLHFAYPFPAWVHWMGWLIVMAGFVLAFSAVRRFSSVHTTLDPHGSVSFVVTSGPYRFTRNPIYVGYLSLTVGIPLIFGNLWGVLLAPLQIVLFNRLVIQAEEAYLSRKFAHVYLDYKARVRRWL